MSFFFNTRRAKEKLAVIFDIGNQSIGAGLVKFPSLKSPEILYTVRRKIQISKKPQGHELLLRMLSTLKDVLSFVFKEGLPHVRFTYFRDIKLDCILYVLASPWHVSQVRIARRKEKFPFRVESDFLGNMVQHEISEFLKMHQVSEITEKKIHTHELIEGDILDIELNKYSTKNPLGKITHELGMTLFATSAPADFLRRLEAMSESEFPHSTNRFASFTFAFFTVVRDTWHNTHNFILLDVSGEMTDLSIVRDGKILEIRSIPLGANTAIRLIAQNLGLTTTESESILARFLKGHLVSSQTKEIYSIVNQAEKQWTSYLAKELREISTQVLLPRDVFLTTDEPYTEWFKRMIDSDGLRSLALVGKPFLSVALGGETLAPYCSFYPGVAKDPFIAIESLFLNRKINVV